MGQRRRSSRRPANPHRWIIGRVWTRTSRGRWRKRNRARSTTRTVANAERVAGRWMSWTSPVPSNWNSSSLQPSTCGSSNWRGPEAR